MISELSAIAGSTAAGCLLAYLANLWGKRRERLMDEDRAEIIKVVASARPAPTAIEIEREVKRRLGRGLAAAGGIYSNLIALEEEGVIESFATNPEVISGRVYAYRFTERFAGR